MNRSSPRRPMPAMTAPRASAALATLVHEAAKGLRAIRLGRSGAVALQAAEAHQRAGAQALLFHVLRHLGLAEGLRAHLAPHKPPPAADALLCTALALAAAPQDRPYDDFTLVNQTVEAAKGDPATRGQAAFINACLRRFLRERDARMAAVANDVVARWNHPLWWIRRVQKDWPEQWQQILHANNVQAPMVLRINRQKSTPGQYLKALEAINVIATECGDNAVVLDRAVSVHDLPGFAEGMVSVQDASAQRAAPLLLAGWDMTSPLHVLDACAAPGGKTAHLLERAGGGSRMQLTSLDVDPERCQRIEETLQRIGLRAQVLAQDAARPQDWWQQWCGGKPFDAILLDAPCTASGIVRRHPDVRWLRRESDIVQLAQVQARLLARLWPLLRPGGRMLYATCSVFRAEGQEQIELFLARNRDARLLPSPGHILPVAADTAPGVLDNAPGGHDGFYYALLEKTEH
ncbi:MAG: 16S rRNA (cytosine(967)-C(5))-methyltransferase RsmB [Burkholderiaceae bacterium]|nr:16S rRNA (cytosine(967)-C(5))-methyltransferase RsmB [Burkholderiaceae bacterium]